MMGSVRPVGDLLREWRQRRRMSQLDLACEAEISTRHLSFVETGRAQPSREMLLHLAEQLEIPLRDRNILLHAAGYAPIFPERTLDDPALQAARRAIERIVAGHLPCPALAVDRHWTLVASNDALAPLLARVDPALLQPPVNALRVGLHPDGLARSTVNYRQWRAHILSRLHRQVELSADPVLAALLNELRDYPAPATAAAALPGPGEREFDGVAVPLQIETDSGVLSFYSTTTVFGTPIDITLSEIAIESFFPADAETAAVLQRLVGPLQAPAPVP
jgi:transcriptional regulator with XRE-family HTH domain